MLLGSGLTQAEQIAFNRLLRFFEGEENPERKALALTVPFAMRGAYLLMNGVELTDDDVANIVMDCIAAHAPDPQIEYLWGQRRDTARDVDTVYVCRKLF